MQTNAFGFCGTNNVPINLCPSDTDVNVIVFSTVFPPVSTYIINFPLKACKGVCYSIGGENNENRRNDYGIQPFSQRA